MDISGLGIVEAASRGSSMPLLNPFTAEPLGVWLQVLGYDADEVVAAGRRFSSIRTLQKQAKGNLDDIGQKKMIAQATAAVVGYGRSAPDKDHPDGEESEALEIGGEKIAIPSKRFTELLNDKNYLWIAVQVQRWGDDRGNYTPEAQSD